LESGKSPNKAADGPATGRNRNGMEREKSGVFCPLPFEFFVGFLIESLNKDSTSYEGSLSIQDPLSKLTYTKGALMSSD